MPLLRGVVQWDGAGAMKADETTYRLYSCARCAGQVRICRRCDRGHRYCTVTCARIQRRESLHRAGARYQRSRRGAYRHAVRQCAWRERCAQEVTHQGSVSLDTAGTVVLVVTDETPSVACDDHLLSECAPLWRTEHRSLLAQRCSWCGGVLPAFPASAPCAAGLER